MLAALARRTTADALFRPRAIAIIGPDSSEATRLARNLQQARFPGRVHRVPTPENLPGPADLALLTAPADPRALARAGVAAAIAFHPGPPADDPASLPLLGPRAFGIIAPAAGLDASLGHLPARPGRLALLSPSAALCRTVLDWAEPNGVGFSHLVGTGPDGGPSSLGAAALLDLLAREPGVGAIMLDVRHVPDPRAFLSAARAAAALRPVVALHAGARQADPTGRHDKVFDAALHRAGVLRVTSLAEFLAAAEVLARARPARADTLMIVTNSIAAGQLAADQATRLGIPLATPDPAAATLLRLNLPEQPPDHGLLWTGDDQPHRAAETVAMLSAVPGLGGIAVVLAPTGDADAAATAALAAAPNLAVPLLVALLGETTAAPNRRALAAAGLPVFASPEQAVRGFAHLVALRRARRAAAELPASRVLRLAPDLARVRRLLDAARAAGTDAIGLDASLDILSAYGQPLVPSRIVAGPEEAAAAAALLGFPATVKRCRAAPDEPGALRLDLADPAAVRAAATALAADAGPLLVQRQVGHARRLRLAVADDPTFGPAIAIGPGGRDRAGEAALDLPPLNLPLAAALLRRTTIAPFDAVADALVRVAQLVVDWPDIATLAIDPLFADEHGTSAAEAWITLRPPGHRRPTAIAPYPAHLVEHWTTRGGQSLELRPIRPEDAEAHAALIARASPEDLRYRFFSLIRALPPEQLARMTQIDYDREIAVIATDGKQTHGVARLVRDPAGAGAEFAILVDAGMKGSGLGRRLMQSIIAWAREHRLAHVTGQVLADNARMLAFVRRLGFQVLRVPDDPEILEARLEL